MNLRPVISEFRSTPFFKSSSRWAELDECLAAMRPSSPEHQSRGMPIRDPPALVNSWFRRTLSRAARGDPRFTTCADRRAPPCAPFHCAVVPRRRRDLREVAARPDAVARATRAPDRRPRRAARPPRRPPRRTPRPVSSSCAAQQRPEASYDLHVSRVGRRFPAAARTARPGSARRLKGHAVRAPLASAVDRIERGREVRAE